MKIFFSYSLSGKANFEKLYLSINDILEKQGHQNINKELLSMDPNEFYKNLAKGDRENTSKITNDLIEKSKKADICLFECSTYTLTTGFLIQKSLESNKPVICLFLEDHLPHFLTGIKDEKFQLIKYSVENLQEKLTESLEKAQTLADKRFNFFISPTLLTYLNKASKEEGVTKSTFIRNLINDYRRKYKS